MHQRTLTIATAAAFGMLLAACGGGSESTTSAAAADSNSRLLAASVSAASSQATGVTFNSAPADNATISGIVRIEDTGNYVNKLTSEVLLVPADAHTPVYGRLVSFKSSASSEDAAYLDLDTTRLPNGPIRVRIVAYDNYGAEAATLMEPRTWNISNKAAPAVLSVASKSVPPKRATLSGIQRLEVRGTGLANVELKSNWSSRGKFNISADRTRAWLDLDTRTIPNGGSSFSIIASDVTSGQDGGQEIVAMQPREWSIQNPEEDSFRAELLFAPVHGEVISGPVYLEVYVEGLQNIELLPATGYEPKYGTFQFPYQSYGGTLLFDPRSLPPGTHEFRISGFDKPAGTPGAKEVVIMPARKWKIQY